MRLSELGDRNLPGARPTERQARAVPRERLWLRVSRVAGSWRRAPWPLATTATRNRLTFGVVLRRFEHTFMTPEGIRKLCKVLSVMMSLIQEIVRSVLP